MKAVGELSWSSVEASENEEGATVVAFSCMARLMASLPSLALMERRCHRSLASMRRPYFSASAAKTCYYWTCCIERWCRINEKMTSSLHGAASRLSSSTRGKPSVIKKGIDKTVQYLIEELEKKLRPVKGSGDIKSEPQL